MKLKLLVVALALTLLAPLASARTLSCPVSYEGWKTQNAFAGGYQGLCSYFTSLSPSGQATFKSAANFTNIGALEELPLDVWADGFASGDWNRGNFNYIVK